MTNKLTYYLDVHMIPLDGDDTDKAVYKQVSMYDDDMNLVNSKLIPIGPTSNTSGKDARRINASLARTASIMERISTGAATHKVNGLPGVWTRYDGIDVFVHQNESIRHAVKRAGCGCTEQKESTKKSIATPRADQAG